MKLLIRCEERRIEVDNAVEASAVINDGLIIGYGSSGMSIALTPKDMPAIMYQYTWAEILEKLLT